MIILKNIDIHEILKNETQYIITELENNEHLNLRTVIFAFEKFEILAKTVKEKLYKS